MRLLASFASKSNTNPHGAVNSSLSSDDSIPQVNYIAFAKHSNMISRFQIASEFVKDAECISTAIKRSWTQCKTCEKRAVDVEVIISWLYRWRISRCIHTTPHSHSWEYMSKIISPTSGGKNITSVFGDFLDRVHWAVTPDSLKMVEGHNAQSSGDAFDIALANVKFG